MQRDRERTKATATRTKAQATRREGDGRREASQRRPGDAGSTLAANLFGLLLYIYYLEARDLRTGSERPIKTEIEQGKNGFETHATGAQQRVAVQLLNRREAGLEVSMDAILGCFHPQRLAPSSNSREVCGRSTS
jgi:hypothetical protein